MFFCDYKTHAIPFFISYSLLPLDLLYFKSVSILKHDVSNNISPPQISSLFHYQHNIHSYITRSSTRGNFFLKYSRITSKICLFREMVLESGIAYPVNFIKCLKRILNATFTICSFRESSETLWGKRIYWFIEFEYALNTELIGHFRVRLSLFFRASLSAKYLLW